MRRNRDRYLRRRKNLLNALTRFGLMPGEEAERRRIAMRNPYELGRVLFHLNQSRGFKSNRKIDRASNEGGLIKEAAARDNDRDGDMDYEAFEDNANDKRDRDNPHTASFRAS
jgi:CRISPR-associated endonuclease Csn1